MTNNSNFTKEQLIARAQHLKEVSATFAWVLEDEPMALDAALMDICLAEIALAALTASERPPEDCGAKGVAIDANYRRQGARTGWAVCLAHILGSAD